MRRDLKNLTQYFEASMEAKGVTPRGILWPNARDLATRFEVLLSPVALESYSTDLPVRLLDLGCGPGFLLDWLALNGYLERVAYTGVDVTEITLRHARARWPDRSFELRDVRERPFDEGAFDYAIICGVFTARFGNSYEEMVSLVTNTLKSVWGSVTQGLSFNVMSKHVDWEREDLFHWPLDEIMAFCKANLSRHVALRLDYGPWETSVLVRRTPLGRQSAVPEAWLSSDD